MAGAELTGIFLDMIGGQKYKMAAPTAGADADGKMEACVLEIARPLAGHAPSVGWGWALGYPWKRLGAVPACSLSRFFPAPLGVSDTSLYLVKEFSVLTI